LLAIGFKTLSQWLPEHFQYFGLWLLLCFVMQGVIGWKLVGLISESRWVRTMAAVFFILAPPMLNRVYAHVALVGHWIVLAALYMYLRPLRRGRAWWWALLVVGAIGIHAYLFAMAAVLWLADVLRRFVESKREARRDSYTPLVFECLTITLLALAVAWQCGFFMVPPQGMGATGFGYYKMNVLAPVDSRGWSAFLPALGGARGEREGFNYLGLGGLLLITVAACALLTRHRAITPGVRANILALVAIVLTLTAITHHVGVGGRQFSIPLPTRLNSVLKISPVQSTGRLFWVPYYLLLWSSVLVLGRVLPARWLGLAVSVCAVMQLVDLRPAVAALRRHNAALATHLPSDALTAPFWGQAAEKYTKVRQWPARVGADGWERVAFYAQQHGMATDMVKLARVDGQAFSAAQARQRAHLLRGRPDSESLYLVSNDYVDLVRANQVMRCLGWTDSMFSPLHGAADCHRLPSICVARRTKYPIH
jgi:hypothetical protein